MITISGVKKYFKDQCIFKGLDLVITGRGVHVIEGESGSGKSTLLMMIMHLEKVDAGKIVTSERPILISQNYELIDDLSVKDNILMGREERYLDLDLVDHFEMRSYLYKRPSELSGGQRQRVGIIRALSFAPSIILCDEPTESLDLTNKILVMDILKHLSKQAIVVLVTHDHKLALEYGDHFYKLEDHDVKRVDHNETLPLKKRKAPHFTKRDMRSIYNKLSFKKDLSFCVLRVVLFGIMIVLVVLSLKWFDIPDTQDTLNHDYVYIEKTIGHGFPYVETGIKNSETKIYPTFRFRSVYSGTQYYQTNIFLNNENDKGIVINEIASEILGLKEGDTVTLYYVVNNVEYPYIGTILKVIEEKDTKEISIYYNYDEFIEYLKTVPFNDPYLYLEDDEKMPDDQYAYLQLRPSYFAFYVPYEKQMALYERLEDNVDVHFDAPLLEERLQFLEDTRLYKIMYYVFEAIVFMAIGVLSFIYLSKDFNRLKGHLAILVSQGMDINYLNAYCRTSKAVFSLFEVITTTVMSFVIWKVCAVDLAIVLIVQFAEVSIVLSELLFILYKAHTLKQKDIAYILKDRWD